MAGVTLEGIVKRYGSVEVLRNVSLSIPDGSLTCLLGPSGSGKTTLLRLIAGLETLEAGSIRIGTQEVTGVEVRDRGVGMMFQGLALYPHMNVRQNIAYPLRVRRVPPQEQRSRVERVAEILGIKEYLDRPVQALSGGQQQRVALGRAIVQEPRVYLLDEPISSLDAQLRAQMREEIRAIQVRLATTMILVSHDQLDALAMADHIAVMHDGILEQFGSAEEVYRSPATRFVAAFVGDPPMNFIDIQFVQGQWMAGGLAWTLPQGVGDQLVRAAGGRAVMGVRPGEWHLDPPDATAAIAAGVVDSQLLGSDVLYTVAAGSLRLRVRESVRALRPAGSPMTLGLDARHIHFFHPDTGRRLGVEGMAA